MRRGYLRTLHIDQVTYFLSADFAHTQTHTLIAVKHQIHTAHTDSQHQKEEATEQDGKNLYGHRGRVCGKERDE